MARDLVPGPELPGRLLRVPGDRPGTPPQRRVRRRRLRGDRHCLHQGQPLPEPGPVLLLPAPRPHPGGGRPGPAHAPAQEGPRRHPAPPAPTPSAPARPWPRTATSSPATSSPRSRPSTPATPSIKSPWSSPGSCPSTGKRPCSGRWNVGAVLPSSVSRRTDFLVVGHQYDGPDGQATISNKEEKARAILAEGKSKLRLLGQKPSSSIFSNPPPPAAPLAPWPWRRSAGI